MSGLLHGRVAVITGAGRGMGLASAQLFAREGAKVVVNAQSENSVNAAVATIKAEGGQAVGAPGDVSRSADVQSVLDRARDEFGGLDILYNNAGIGYSATERMGIGMNDAVACSEEDWRRTLDINLTGVREADSTPARPGVRGVAPRAEETALSWVGLCGLPGGLAVHLYRAEGTTMTRGRPTSVAAAPPGR